MTSWGDGRAVLVLCLGLWLVVLISNMRCTTPDSWPCSAGMREQKYAVGERHGPLNRQQEIRQSVQREIGSMPLGFDGRMKLEGAPHMTTIIT